MLGNSEDIKNFAVKSHSTKTKTYFRLQKDCNCNKSFPIQLLRGQWWLANHIKVAESSFWFNHQFSFLKLFEVFDTGMHCQFVVQNCHWSIKVPLSCNLMGYLLAIKIKGHDFNMP